jgi:hypothetical protein
MSIYCSIFDFGSEHKPRCRRVIKIGRGYIERNDALECTCGNCPIIYQGSHVLPSNKDERGGEFGISAIPDHITRNGRRGNPKDGEWYPWLRVHLDGGGRDTVILNKKQVVELRDALNEWIARAAG